MKTVGSRELKNRLGRYLGLCPQGETIIVTDRGKAVAHISPQSTPIRIVTEVWINFKTPRSRRAFSVGTRPFKRVKPVRLKGKPVSKSLWKIESDALPGFLRSG